jgi:putative peptidoglycan lipid II flippase
MTGRADYGNARSFDPDATVSLPVVTPNPQTGGARPVWYDSQPTVVLPAVAAPGPGTGPGASQEDAGSVARNSAMMAALSIVSRVTGLLRTVALAAAVGAKAVSNDYNVANTLPNMVYELLLGGVLASVVVPLLVRARSRDADRGEAYAHRLLTLATVFLGAATLVAVVAAPLLTTLMSNQATLAADRRLTTVLAYLLLPEIFFYGMAALLAAILNTRSHFAAPMWTPILNNIVVIVTAAVFLLLPPAGTPPQAGRLTVTHILVLGVGTTLGIVVQAAGLVPALRKVGFRWRWRWDFRELHLGELARIGGWMMGYVLISQVGVMVALKIAWTAAGRAGAPGPTVYLNSYLIFMMAHGIVAVSILTALMPRMSAAAAEGRYSDVAKHLSMGTRLSAVILVPATAAYLVLGRPLGVTLFGYGNYGTADAAKTGWVIAVAGLGLVPFAISQLQLGAFYAMPDTRTPALLNVPIVAIRVTLQCLTLLGPMAAVAAGLMGGNTLSYVFGAALGYGLLRKRIGRLGLREVGATLARLTLAAGIAAVPTGLVVYGLSAVLDDNWLGSLIQLVVGAVVLLAGYVGAAVILRVPEVTELGGMLRARLGR